MSVSQCHTSQIYLLFLKFHLFCNLKKQMMDLVLPLLLSYWLAISSNLKRGWNQWFQVQINKWLFKPQRK